MTRRDSLYGWQHACRLPNRFRMWLSRLHRVDAPSWICPVCETHWDQHLHTAKIDFNSFTYWEFRRRT